MSERTVLSLKKLSKAQFERLQTGKANRMIHSLMIEMQAAAGVGTAKAPHEYCEFGTYVYTGATATTHYEYDSTNCKYFEAISRITCTAWTLWKQYAEGGRPTVDRAADHQAVFFWYYNDFLAGLQRRKMPLMKDDGSTATTIEEAITGHAWTDAGVGTSDRHWTKLRVMFYAYGLKYSKMCPKQSSRIEQTSQAQVIFDEQIYLLMTRVMTEIYYDFVGAQGQTAYAIDCLGMTTGSIMKSKAYSEFSTPMLDPAWIEFMKEQKVAVLTHATGQSQYCEITADYGEETLVTGTDLQNVIYEISETFTMPKASVAFARKYFGLGVYDNNKYFFNALLGAIPGTTNYSTNHGKSIFVYGLETAIHLQLLRKLKKLQLPKLLEQAIEMNTHYHFDDLKPFFSDLFQDYQYGKTLQGFCEPYAYIGAMSAFKFTTKAGELMHTAIPVDPQFIHASSAIKTGHANYSSNLLAYLYLGDSIPDYYLMHFPNGVTYEEIAAKLTFEWLMSLTASTSWGTNRFTAYKMYHFEIYDCLNPKKRLCWCCATSTTEVIRVECIKDPTSHSIKYVAMKYVQGLESGSVAFSRYLSEPRPYGEAEPIVIENIGMPEIQQQLLELLVPSVPSKTEGKKEVKEEKKKPDKPKESKEPKDTTTQPKIETEQELTESTN